MTRNQGGKTFNWKTIPLPHSLTKKLSIENIREVNCYIACGSHIYCSIVARFPAADMGNYTKTNYVLRYQFHGNRPNLGILIYPQYDIFSPAQCDQL
jgi:hypothetical protein